MKRERGKNRKTKEIFHDLWVQVKPWSVQDRITGFNEEGFLVIHVRALPTKGQANQSCCIQLSRALQLPRSQIFLEKGRVSRKKKFRVEGLTREEGEIRLGRVIRGADTA